jgi:hypothetical protein
LAFYFRFKKLTQSIFILLVTHARRSWIVFKEVLNPEIKVGIIAAEPQDYNPQEWWKSSEGFRTVTGEIIAYIYARFVDWKS